MKLLDDFYKIISNYQIDGKNCYKIQLNKDNYIYKAHFPNNPITPGVCIIQIVTELLEQTIGKSLKLAIVKNIKYLSVIIPTKQQTLDIVFSKIENNNNECKAQVSIEFEGTTFTKLSLIYNLLD